MGNTLLTHTISDNFITFVLAAVDAAKTCKIGKPSYPVNSELFWTTPEAGGNLSIVWLVLKFAILLFSYHFATPKRDLPLSIDWRIISNSSLFEILSGEIIYRQLNVSICIYYFFLHSKFLAYQLLLSLSDTYNDININIFKYCGLKCSQNQQLPISHCLWFSAPVPNCNRGLWLASNVGIIEKHRGHFDFQTGRGGLAVVIELTL